MLKSMIDSIEGDIKGVSAAQSQLVEFSERINSSHKALLTLHKFTKQFAAGTKLQTRT